MSRTAKRPRGGYSLYDSTHCRTKSLGAINFKKNPRAYHGLTGDELDDGGITGLDEFGGSFNGFTCSAIDLLNELGELAGDVGSVAIEDRSVTSTNLTGVVEDDDLSVERSGLLGGIVLGVRGDISTTNILDRHVPICNKKRIKR